MIRLESIIRNTRSLCKYESNLYKHNLSKSILQNCYNYLFKNDISNRNLKISVIDSYNIETNIINYKNDHILLFDNRLLDYISLYTLLYSFKIMDISMFLDSFLSQIYYIKGSYDQSLFFSNRFQEKCKQYKIDNIITTNTNHVFIMERARKFQTAFIAFHELEHYNYKHTQKKDAMCYINEYIKSMEKDGKIINYYIENELPKFGKEFKSCKKVKVPLKFNSVKSYLALSYKIIKFASLIEKNAEIAKKKKENPKYIEYLLVALEHKLRKDEYLFYFDLKDNLDLKEEFYCDLCSLDDIFILESQISDDMLSINDIVFIFKSVLQSLYIIAFNEACKAFVESGNIEKIINGAVRRQNFLKNYFHFILKKLHNKFTDFKIDVFLYPEFQNIIEFECPYEQIYYFMKKKLYKHTAMQIEYLSNEWVKKREDAEKALKFPI